MADSILDHRIISERYFYPHQVHFENPFWVECDGARLSCYYQQKHNESKTVVFFHGNGEVVPDYIDFYVPLFDKLGYNCFLAEYRGYGMSTGAPGLNIMLDDVDRIIKTIGLPQKKLIIFGRSVGSIYALHAASLFPEVAGLIIESGIADILERLLIRVIPGEIGATEAQMEKAVNEKLNHRRKIEKFKGKTLIMHAQRDTLINQTHGKRLYKWAPEPKTLKMFSKGGHNDIFFENQQEYIEEIIEFLRSL